MFDWNRQVLSIGTKENQKEKLKKQSIDRGRRTFIVKTRVYELTMCLSKLVVPNIFVQVTPTS